MHSQGFSVLIEVFVEKGIYLLHKRQPELLTGPPIQSYKSNLWPKQSSSHIKDGRVIEHKGRELCLIEKLRCMFI